MGCVVVVPVIMFQKKTLLKSANLFKRIYPQCKLQFTQIIIVVYIEESSISNKSKDLKGTGRHYCH